MDKKDEKKKKKKKIDDDTLTVLAILGGLILICVILAWLTRNDTTQELPKLTGGQSGKVQERISPLPIILTGTFLSLFVVVLFFVNRIRAKRRKQMEEQMERLRRLKELEEAKEKVQNAKMEALLQAGKKEISKREKDARLLRGEASKMSAYEREDYLRKRRELYAREEEEQDETEAVSEEESILRRILRKIKEIFLYRKKKKRSRDED